MAYAVPSPLTIGQIPPRTDGEVGPPMDTGTVASDTKEEDAKQGFSWWVVLVVLVFIVLSMILLRRRSKAQYS